MEGGVATERKMSVEKKRRPGEQLVWNYPQLTLAPEEGLKETENYKDIVLRGKLPGECVCPFLMSEQDSLQEMDTPAGKVEVYFLYHREDFERAVRLLAWRGEPRPLPASMGAVTIRGLNNWRKLNACKARYLVAGNTDWNAEFGRMTQNEGCCSDREARNMYHRGADGLRSVPYKDTIILLSNGYYSAVPPGEAGFSEGEWTRHSRMIRTWHELAHVVSRRLYPDNRETIRDEVVADCIGLLAAFGTYDLRLARLFLGITEEGYRPGGRLENYLPGQDAGQEAVRVLTERVRRIMGALDGAADGKEPFECLRRIEEGRIGLNCGR